MFSFRLEIRLAFSWIQLDPEAAVVVGRCAGARKSDDQADGGGDCEDCGHGCPGPQVAG